MPELVEGDSVDTWRPCGGIRQSQVRIPSYFSPARKERRLEVYVSDTVEPVHENPWASLICSMAVVLAGYDSHRRSDADRDGAGLFCRANCEERKVRGDGSCQCEGRSLAIRVHPTARGCQHYHCADGPPQLLAHFVQAAAVCGGANCQRTSLGCERDDGRGS